MRFPHESLVQDLFHASVYNFVDYHVCGTKWRRLGKNRLVALSFNLNTIIARCDAFDLANDDDRSYEKEVIITELLV